MDQKIGVFCLIDVQEFHLWRIPQPKSWHRPPRPTYIETLFFPKLSWYGLLSYILFPHLKRTCHRVDRVLGLFSSRLNWEPPTLYLTRRRVWPPPLLVPGGGGDTLACGAGDRVVGSQCGRGDRHSGYSRYIYVLWGTCFVLDIRKSFLFRERLLGGEMWWQPWSQSWCCPPPGAGSPLTWILSVCS